MRLFTKELHKLFTESKDVKSEEDKAVVNFEKMIPAVKKWSAEKPNLYSLVIKSERQEWEYISKVSAQR